MDIAVILSFIFFMSIFAGVGLASVRVKKDTTDDYLVAGRGMSPLSLHYLQLVLGILGTCSLVS